MGEKECFVEMTVEFWHQFGASLFFHRFSQLFVYLY